MNRPAFSLIFCLSLLLQTMFCPFVSAQMHHYALNVRVVNALNGSPVAGAQIVGHAFAGDTFTRVSTGPNGMALVDFGNWADFDVTVGRQAVIDVAAPGFQSLTAQVLAPADQLASVDVNLTPGSDAPPPAAPQSPVQNQTVEAPRELSAPALIIQQQPESPGKDIRNLDKTDL